MSTLDTQILNDGERNATIKGYITGDAAQLADAVLVDVSALSGSPSAVKLIGVKANLNGFSATLEWDATADVPILEIPPNEDVDQCFRRFGGLQNNAGAGVTGDITISTLGIAAGENGYVIVEVQKS